MPTTIQIEAYSPDGQQITGEFSGYTARIFQHEIDHLDGLDFVSRITNDNHLHWVKKAEFGLYRNNEGWRNWPHKCTRQRWQELKDLPTN